MKTSRPETIHRPAPHGRRPALVATLLAGGMLTLCACNGPQHAPGAAAVAPGAMPRAACPPPMMAPPFVGPPTMGPPGMEQGVPTPFTPTGPWAPPGIERPWPADEYLRDGGVAGPGVDVQSDWSVVGLNAEDAVAHFDTVAGQTVVVPTNPVYLYSPRFAAVRQVVNIVQTDQWNATAGVYKPVGATGHVDVEVAANSRQDVQALREVGTKGMETLQVKQFGAAVSARLGPRTFVNGYQPFENFTIIRTGEYNGGEMLMLARSSQNAVAWSKDEAVNVILNGQAANATVGIERAEEVHTVKGNPQPRLRVVKVASSQMVKPGELVAFTIRFDNVGNQTIGNVTILDNLSARLEYVADTAQCSLPAEFSTQTNDVGSQVLRWEITPPVEPGRGGVVRFTARVR